METIINRLQDEESKMLYMSRVESAITNNDMIYLDNVYSMDKQWKSGEYNRLLDSIGEDRNLFIFGAGNFGIMTLSLLKKMGLSDRIQGFIDNDKGKQGTVINGVMVYSRHILTEYPNTIVLIAMNRANAGSAYMQLKAMYELDDRNIFCPRRGHLVLNTGKQYFDVFKPCEGEVFVDAGASFGNTSVEFAKWAKEYSCIYAFEPRANGRYMYEKMAAKNNLHDYYFYDKGLFSCSTTLSFEENGSGSKIVDTGENIIEVVSIDEILAGKKVTFIKMDLEGSERESLIGATECIKKWHPRMAISLYHKTEDIIEIPKTILSIDETYKFLIRQYNTDMSEMVLYAY